MKFSPVANEGEAFSVKDFLRGISGISVVKISHGPSDPPGITEQFADFFVEMNRVYNKVEFRKAFLASNSGHASELADKLFELVGGQELMLEG